MQLIKTVIVHLLLLIGFIISSNCYALSGNDVGDPAKQLDSAQQDLEQNKNAPRLGGFFNNLGATGQQMTNKIGPGLTSAIYSAGITIGVSMVPWASAVAGALALIYLLYASIEFLTEKNGSFIHVIFDMALPLGFCAYLLLDYSNQIQNFAGENGFLQPIRMIAADPVSGLFQMYGSILTSCAGALTEVWLGVATKLVTLDLAAAFVSALDALLACLFVVFILMLCLAGMAEVIGLVLMGPFLGAVAMAFGPIFIAGIVTPWTAEYFKKWLGFLVASAVFTGVLGVCIKISTQIFSTVRFVDVVGTGGSTAVGLVISAILLMSINSLLSQVPSIAEALVPGGFGVKRGAGKGVSDGAKSVKDNVKGGINKAKEIGKNSMNISKMATTKINAFKQLK